MQLKKTICAVGIACSTLLLLAGCGHHHVSSTADTARTTQGAYLLQMPNSMKTIMVDNGIKITHNKVYVQSGMHANKARLNAIKDMLDKVKGSRKKLAMARLTIMKDQIKKSQKLYGETHFVFDVSKTHRDGDDYTFVGHYQKKGTTPRMYNHIKNKKSLPISLSNHKLLMNPNNANPRTKEQRKIMKSRGISYKANRISNKRLVKEFDADGVHEID